MVRTEFHIHTKYSHDSAMGMHALARMCKLRHIDCLAITDHNEIAGALAFKPYLESQGIQVIVGEEVFTSEGEIIGLWLSEHIERGLTPEETIAEIRRQGGLVYVPHPYDEKRYKTVLKPEALARVANDIDCIEVHNGRNISAEYDAKQKAIAEQYNLPQIIGCDAHCFFEVGRNYVESAEPFTKENFLNNLASSTFHGSQCLSIAHTGTKLVRGTRILRKEGVGGILRVLNRKIAH